LTPARVRGIRETHANLIVFVDDDNVLVPEYLEQVVALAAEHSHLGVFGPGVIDPEFETQPSPDVQPWLHYLALRNLPVACWTTDPREVRCLPWGAGLCMRRSVAESYVDWVVALGVPEVLDRIGERLFCGGDDLFSFVAARGGWGVGLFPELQITHLIPEVRLQAAYLRRLVHDHAYSHGVLGYVLYNERPSALSLFILARILLHGVRRGQLSMRFRWAAALGAQRAARFIASTALEPLGAVVRSGEIIERTCTIEDAAARRWTPNTSR
jgi:GT2 family glycosyltransferase